MADLLDVVTLHEARTAVSLGGTHGVAHDEVLESWITAVSRRMDFLCGPIVERTITAERHDGGSELLRLNYSPVVSITSVTEYAGGAATVLSAETEIAAGTYRVDIDKGLIYRRSGWSSTSFGSQSVLVTYVAGRYATTAAVDARFKEAAKTALSRWWKRDGAVWAQSPDAFGDIGDQDMPRFFKIIDPIAKELVGDKFSLEGHGLTLA